MFLPNRGSIEPDGDHFRVVVDSMEGVEMFFEKVDLKRAMTAYGADIRFKRASKKEGGQPFIGWIGRAYRSKSGRALNLKIDGQLYSVAMSTFQAMLDGHYTAVGISRYEKESPYSSGPVPITF